MRDHLGRALALFLTFEPALALANVGAVPVPKLPGSGGAKHIYLVGGQSNLTTTISYLREDGSHAQATGTFTGHPGDYVTFQVTSANGSVRSGPDLDYLEFDSNTYFASCQSNQAGTSYPFLWHIRRLSNPGGPVNNTGKLILLDWTGAHMTVEVLWSTGPAVQFRTTMVP